MKKENKTIIIGKEETKEKETKQKSDDKFKASATRQQNYMRKWKMKMEND